MCYAKNNSLYKHIVTQLFLEWCEMSHENGARLEGRAPKWFFYR